MILLQTTLTYSWITCTSRVEVLNQELTQQHGAKLEWIIIWLLVIEIVISVGWDILLKDILGLFRHN